VSTVPSSFGEAQREVQKMAAGLGGWVVQQAKRRIPAADMDERDPDYMRDQLALTWLFASLWYRADVRHLERVPAEGPVLMVGNHSGGNMTPDTLVFTLAFVSYFGVERRFHQLAHNLVVSHPAAGILRKFGTVAANRGNASAILESGAALLVYPGGDYEVHRPSWEGNVVDFGGRTGFIRTALDAGVPIVPVVSIGGQETALFLSRGEWLAKALGLDKAFRLKVMPVSLALPWVVNIGDFMGHIPLPAKITIEVLDPFDVKEQYGDDPDLQDVYADIIGQMQERLDALAAERRLPVIG